MHQSPPPSAPLLQLTSAMLEQHIHATTMQHHQQHQAQLSPTSHAMLLSHFQQASMAAPSLSSSSLSASRPFTFQRLQSRRPALAPSQQLDKQFHDAVANHLHASDDDGRVSPSSPTSPLAGAVFASGAAAATGGNSTAVSDLIHTTIHTSHDMTRPPPINTANNRLKPHSSTLKPPPINCDAISTPHLHPMPSPLLFDMELTTPIYPSPSPQLDTNTAQIQYTQPQPSPVQSIHETGGDVPHRSSVSLVPWATSTASSFTSSSTSSEITPANHTKNENAVSSPYITTDTPLYIPASVSAQGNRAKSCILPVAVKTSIGDKSQEPRVGSAGASQALRLAGDMIPSDKPSSRKTSSSSRSQSIIDGQAACIHGTRISDCDSCTGSKHEEEDETEGSSNKSDEDMSDAHKEENIEAAQWAALSALHFPPAPPLPFTRPDIIHSTESSPNQRPLAASERLPTRTITSPDGTHLLPPTASSVKFSTPTTPVRRTPTPNRSPQPPMGGNSGYATQQIEHNRLRYANAWTLESPHTKKSHQGDDDLNDFDMEHLLIGSHSPTAHFKSPEVFVPSPFSPASTSPPSHIATAKTASKATERRSSKLQDDSMFQMDF